MELSQRRPTRLRNYDYSNTGYYFVTICTHNRKNLLSNIIVGEGLPLPQLTIQGEIANKYILLVSKKYPSVKIDKYIIMPNHIHIIMCIDNNGRGNPSPTISNVIGWLKYNITKQINRKYNTIGTNVFQRSFHDHIIRDKNDYLKIWNYIDTNPQKWEDDCFYSE
ncbi:MAG: transposase [Clostridia bacterium]|nr:transposase [Clostridia bacterium]